MEFDLWRLYRLMLYSRKFEEAVKRLWNAGQISGEMHMGIGEEAITVGVAAHLQDGDSLALDHRGTSPLLLAGVDPVALLRELLGRADGLCGGMGGHMHLFSPEHLAASSGIVGASGPTGVGFALAAEHLRPGRLAVAYFGEGAANQGMMLESFNLAVAWKLPVLFVCKDDGWAILTDTRTTAGADLVRRAEGFGMPGASVDGVDVQAVWDAARQAVTHIRQGQGPYFLHARCVHMEGHFLGDPYLRFTRRPTAQIRQIAGPLSGALVVPGGLPFGERLAGMRNILSLIQRANRQRLAKEGDPIWRARQELLSDAGRLLELENQVTADVKKIVGLAASPAGEEEA